MPTEASIEGYESGLNDTGDNNPYCQSSQTQEFQDYCSGYAAGEKERLELAEA
jgi:hypothetical protein